MHPGYFPQRYKPVSHTGQLLALTTSSFRNLLHSLDWSRRLMMSYWEIYSSQCKVGGRCGVLEIFWCAVRKLTDLYGKIVLKVYRPVLLNKLR